MGWFGKDTPIEIYEKNLMSAVKDGNLEQLKVLLQTQLDIPAAVFNKALKKAISEDKVKTVEMLLTERKTDWSVSRVDLADIAWNENRSMFQALYKGGFNFDNARYEGENVGTMNAFLRVQIALWKKEIAYDAVVEELKEAKRQLLEKESDFPEKIKFPPSRSNQPGSGPTGGA